MKKIISPIIYATFLIPTIIGTIIVISIVDNYFGLSKFLLNGLLETIFSIIFVGFTLFWLANTIICEFEKLQQPKFSDHVRQSAIFYLAGFFGTITFLAYGYHNGMREAIFFMILPISILAIVTNAIFLYKKNKPKIKNK